MGAEALFTVCVVCMIIMFVVVAANTIMWYTTRNDMKKHQFQLDENTSYIKQITDDMDVVLAKIESGIKYKIDSSAISVLDLAEFKDLDPYMKTQYKRYILDILAPAIMKGINKTMRDNDLQTFMKAHDAQITEAVYQIAKKIQYNGVSKFPELYDAALATSDKFK